MPVWGHEVYSHLESDKGVSDGMDCIGLVKHGLD